MFNLTTASLEIRKCAKALGIRSGRWEPVNAQHRIETLPDSTVIARVFNRNYPGGKEITAGDIKYAGRYL